MQIDGHKMPWLYKGFQEANGTEDGHFAQDKIDSIPPFQSVGLDMMGPFEVKFHGSRAIHKVWAIVFACMRTRSVHVKLVHKSDANSLLQAIACFSARQPGTKHFVSDNGGNLTKADKLLKQELKEYNKSTLNIQDLD